MTLHRPPPDDEPAGRFHPRRRAWRGLRFVEEGCRFRIDPRFRIRRWGLMDTIIASSLVLLVACGELLAYSFAGILYGPGSLVLEYALWLRDASRGPFVVVDRGRWTIAIRRTRDVYPIADVEAVILLRESWPGPDGLKPAAQLDLALRRGGAVEGVEALWGRDVGEVESTAAELARAIDRPLVVTPGHSG